MNYADYTNDGNTPLMYAAEGAHVIATNVLLGLKADIHSVNTHGKTALHIAADDLSVIEELLFNHANVNSQDCKGNSSLMYLVSESGNEDAIKALINASSAAVNMQNNSGNSVLGFAVVHGILPATQILIAAGALIDTANIDGNTVLMLAAHLKDLDAVQMLLNAKADVNVMNKDEKMAWALVPCDPVNEGLIELLLPPIRAYVDLY